MEYDAQNNHKIASCPKAWGQVANILDETINFSGDEDSSCRCHYRRLSVLPVELFSKQPSTSEDPAMKISQPLPQLQSFLVFATVMSYIGLRHEIVDLLQ